MRIAIWRNLRNRTWATAFGLLMAAGPGLAHAEQGGIPAQVAALQQQVQQLQALVANLQAQVASQQQLAAQVAALQSQVGALQNNPVLGLGPYVTVDPYTEKGLVGPHVVFSGVNVHIRNGLGSTVGVPSDPSAAPNGLGNLVIGYNEDGINPAKIDAGRIGSHNLVVGPQHRFSAAGGVVGGFANFSAANHASVTAGGCNTAGAPLDVSVLGDACVSFQFTDGIAAGVYGGIFNSAAGGASNVSGGSGNAATGAVSIVIAGTTNVAQGIASSVTGGTHNQAVGNGSHVGGGVGNVASQLQQDIP